jgi:predicted amidophosphoribosyltransferase
VLDLLLPRRCVCCGSRGAELCGPCRTAIPELEPPLCARCGAPTAWPVQRCRECSGRRLAFSRARAAAAYEGSTRQLISGWKERGLRRLAAEAAAIVVDRLERPAAVDRMTFVPPEPGRRLDRGYHPADALARELGRAWELPWAPLLHRTRGGGARPQRGLGLAERRRNVRGAFASETVSGAFLLVDDVYTSGATADAAARALRSAGAAAVEVVTFARTIRTPRVGLEKRR